MHCPGLGPALCFPASAAGTLQATVQGHFGEVPGSLDEAVNHFRARRVRVGGSGSRLCTASSKKNNKA
ncbi:unnamed protein product [Symbiodinium sp. CCMP2592]|nr:unnamed protein product [Symbiodinium sp. CCMP2592]